MSVHDFLHARMAPAAHVDVTPTPLLAHLAGHHAERIALVWPAPHGEFLALPAARRHLAALALMHMAAERHARLRALLTAAPLNEVIRFALVRPPRGLARALAHLGEPLAAPDLYRRLLDLLEEREAAAVLHHAAPIDANLLAKLEALPVALRKPRILALTADAHAARTLAEAFDLALRINPRRPERDLALAWARAVDAPRLYRTAIEALKAHRFGAYPPPPAMKRPYRQVTALAALEREALRFRNCVASYVYDIGVDQMAVYVRDADPVAMIALKRDLGGWRFAEALGPENAALAEPALRLVAADFAAAGVRLGQPMRAIEDRLEALADAAPEAPAPPATYAGELGLGQLWR
jgi:hypothetical protein